MELAGYVSEICRFLVALVLASAAFTKASEPGSFANSLVDDFHVPARLGKPLGLAIIVGELLACAGMLLGGTAARAAAGLALIMFVSFSVVVLEAVVNDRRVRCNCFGRSSQPVSPLDLLRNAIYIGAAGFYLANAHHAAAGSAWAQVSLVMTAMLLFLLSVSMHEIRNLLRG